MPILKLMFNQLMDDDPGAAGGGGPGGGGGQGDPGAGGGTDWASGLPEEARSSDLFKPLEGKPVAELWKAYEGTSRMVGGRIPIPDETASEEVRAEFNQKLANVPGVMVMPKPDDAEAMGEFWNKLGRPQDPAGYKLSKPENLPDGVEWSDEAMKPWAEAFHKAGLTQTQAQQLVDQQLQTVAANAEKARTEAEQGATQLKTAWGGAYEQNLGIARAALREKYGEDTARQYDHALTTDPLFAELALNFGRGTLEDSVQRGFGTGGNLAQTPAEIQEQITQIQADPAYADDKHPNHKAVVTKATRLFQQLHGTQ